MFSLGSEKPESLIDMKAGKMYLKNDMLYPDKRKGLVFVYKSADGLTHFCWKDRQSGVDLILFPEDVEVKKLDCKTGRVYQLKFKSGHNKQFFWMQEPKDKDEHKWKKLINIVNGDSQSEENLMENSVASKNDMNDGDIQKLLGGLNRNQLVQILSSNFGNIGNILSMNNPSTASQTTTLSSGTQVDSKASGSAQGTATTNKRSNQSQISNSNKSKKIELSMLQDVLANLDAPPSSKSELSFPDIEVCRNILKNPDHVKSLILALPAKLDASQSDELYIEENIRSPQFKQAFRIFYQAFQSGQLTSVIKEFGWKGKVLEATSQGDWSKFVKALEEHFKMDQQDPSHHSLD